MTKDLRWSYDPRTLVLDVWDSDDGRIDHHRRHGQDGFENCSQGRIYPEKGYAMIYGNRPFIVNGKLLPLHPKEPNPDLTKLLEDAKLAVEDWAKSNCVTITQWVTNY